MKQDNKTKKVIDVSEQKAYANDLKEQLTLRFDELKVEINKTNANYEAEIVSWAKEFGENPESRQATRALKEISDRYAEIFADQEDAVKEIEDLLVKLDNANYV